MRRLTATTCVAMVLVGLTAGLPRPSHAADSNYWAANGQAVMVARNTGPNVFALMQDIQRLQSQIRQLRGRIQMLKHRIQRNSRIRKRMYQKLDKRITALEKGNGTTVDKEAVKNAYLAAFKKLRDGQYNAAIDSFQSFIHKYPKNSYSDNAWYWMGQARYVQGNLSGALQALQTVTNKFPKSSKMPSTLFRMGVIKSTQGKSSQARSLFKRVINNYPDSDSADMARGRLKDM